MLTLFLTQSSFLQRLVIEGISLHFIHNRRLKNSYITVDKMGEVTLKSSNNQEQFLSQLVSKKRSWIIKKQQQVKLHQLPDEVLGESIYFMGRLQSIKNFPDLQTKISALKVRSDEKIESAYSAFFKHEAELYIGERLAYFAKVMQLHFSGVRFRKMRRRWGSCSSKRLITFNSRLIRLSSDMIDYVVVHELAHLVHMNHSKSFHDLVRATLPHADTIRQLLKETPIA